MALQSVYERFLAAPNPLSLTENAALHYVPTLTTYTESGPVIRHLEKQNKSVVKIKSTKVISAVEGPTSLAVEVDTTLEFISGGGSYLPGLENFVTDRIATLPLTHIVIFDHDNKIKQIRISWDQATLLKQVDIIGSRGKNWPIVDGKDQIRLIASSEKAYPAFSSTEPTSPRGRQTQENGVGARNPSPNKKYMKDPHTSLDLFEPAKNDENQTVASGNFIAPRMSAKPPPREMSELFAAGHEDFEPSKQIGGSPKKSYDTKVVAPKAGGGHRFQPSRLFEEEPDFVSPTYKSLPTKYNHFDLGDEADDDPLQRKAPNTSQTSQVPLRPKTNKHMSQWDFQDFVTPSKVNPKVREQDVVHFGWGDDDNSQIVDASRASNATTKSRGDTDAPSGIKGNEPPVNRETAVSKQRKDAQTHFEFDDEATPALRRIIARPAAAASGLYQNNVHTEEEDDEEATKGKTPLATITNNIGRKNDFGSHWEMRDSSPSVGHMNNENKSIADDRKKAVHMMNAQWSSYDESPEQVKAPASKPQFRKGTDSQWSMGGDDEDETSKRKGHGTSKNYWDF